MFWFIIFIIAIAVLIGIAIWEKKKKEEKERQERHDHVVRQIKCDKLVKAGATCNSCRYKNSDNYHEQLYCAVGSYEKGKYGVCHKYSGSVKITD